MEQGFIEDIESIINKCSVKPQIEVFSATISKRVESFLKKFIDADYTLTLKDETPTSSTLYPFIDKNSYIFLTSSFNEAKINNKYGFFIFKNFNTKSFIFLCFVLIK